MSPRTAAIAGLNVLLLITSLIAAGPAEAFSLFPGDDVRIDSGIVQGRVTSDHREFLGIPFAAPPTGARRFAAPQQPGSWAGERPARDHGPACAQSLPIVATAYPSSEDCLYLDVYTPPAAKSAAGAKLPVMVWLYGGAYAMGATAQYDPTPMVTKGGVIVVEISYRVGPFGFLALPGLDGADGSAGNYGLADQQAGLRWVRRNIAAFGGDRSNVTLFGESAGGNSVCQQLASPAAAGLFQRAIVMSGFCGPSPLNAVSRTTAYARGAAYTREVGCADAVTAVTCLRGRTQAELLAPPGVAFTSMKLTFVPTVDGVSVLRQPIEAFATGQYARVPIMLGGQQDEGRLFVALFHHLTDLRRMTPAQYAAEVRAVFGARAGAILAQYPPSAFARIDPDSATDLAQAAVWTDGLLACSMTGAIQALQRQPGQVVYAYEFNDPAPPLAGGDPYMDLGDFHGSDLFSLFAVNSGIPVIHLDPAQQSLSDRMISHWTTFARTGNPGAAGGSAWPAWSAAAPRMMPLSSATTTPFPASSFDAAHHCSFWAGLS